MKNQNSIKMTKQETKRLKLLQKQLAYGKGIFVDEFDELKELRKKWLIEMGDNPDHYELSSRYCEKKLAFRK